MHGYDMYDSQARMYDPLIGRPTTMDPLAEKYYSISPYAWCSNNPVRFVDPDGRDVRVATTKNDVGRTIVTFNVTMSVSNKSYLSNETVSKRAAEVKSQIEESFSGYDSKNNTEYKTIVNFDNSEKNFVLEFTSDVEKGSYGSQGRVDEIGNTTNNRMQVLLQKKPDGEPLQTKDETTRTGAHEYGHTVGLQHGGVEESVLKSKTESNLMNQSRYTKSTDINIQQLEKAKNTVINNQKKD